METRIQDQLDSFADQFAALFSKMDDSLKALQDVAAIPRGDTPTVDEMLAQAKSDPVQRKILEATLAELEFADPQIEFN